ncbi:MAG: hypothetical protein ACKOAH_26475, partial [Pirellula sp.]
SSYGIDRLIRVAPNDPGIDAAKGYTQGDMYSVVIDATGNRWVRLGSIDQCHNCCARNRA